MRYAMGSLNVLFPLLGTIFPNLSPSLTYRTPEIFKKYLNKSRKPPWLYTGSDILELGRLSQEAVMHIAAYRNRYRWNLPVRLSGLSPSPPLSGSLKDSALVYLAGR